ncbi:MAG: hypothetical protein GXP25_01985 [Planctomycetes bacterium]|nr:hypothetical protein [Planctomycetota bacterium]
MPIIMQQKKEEIRFAISGEIIRRMYDWQRTVDEVVFNEPLATGAKTTPTPRDTFTGSLPYRLGARFRRNPALAPALLRTEFPIVGRRWLG